jgi:tungstate transport system ATP-binding protein
MNLELVVSSIFKSYDGERVIEDCSFTFDKNGAYVLMGQNGSGKSTFLRICCLLEEPDRGEVNFFSEGLPVKKDIELKRRLTLLLPKIGVFNTTVFKNVAYGLKIRGSKGEEIEERVDKALDFVGLIHKKNQKAPTLSSGETQRLGIARAMVIEPEIIFLDEPTASIDQKNRELIEEIILRMKNDRRSIIVITTHDVAQAERFSDRLMIMQNGKIFEKAV